MLKAEAIEAFKGELAGVPALKHKDRRTYFNKVSNQVHKMKRLRQEEEA
jgi:hypothetical protein